MNGRDNCALRRLVEPFRVTVKYNIQQQTEALTVHVEPSGLFLTIGNILNFMNL